MDREEPFRSGPIEGEVSVLARDRREMTPRQHCVFEWWAADSGWHVTMQTTVTFDISGLDDAWFVALFRHGEAQPSFVFPMVGGPKNGVTLRVP